MKIAILGGSSPFTAALINALKPILPQGSELVLHGRNQRNLTLLRQYGDYHLDARISATTRLDRALEGCDIVVQQIRFGGLELREEGEHFCASHGLPADETLGPAALLTGLQIRQDLEPLCETINQHCPKAWVLNLTNPLSAVTRLMAYALPQAKVVGLCELPDYTLKVIAQLLQVPADEVTADYIGLNHRGFLYNIQHQGRPLIPQLFELPPRVTVNGIERETVGSFNAVPLKYFRYFTHPETSEPGRSQYLNDLREAIAEELHLQPRQSPPSLEKRYLEWYPMAVAPVIATLLGQEEKPQMVNALGSCGTVIETRALLTEDSITLLPSPEAPPAVNHWMQRFLEHEHAFNRVLEEPCFENVKRTLRLDPTVPEAKATFLAQELWCYASSIKETV